MWVYRIKRSRRRNMVKGKCQEIYEEQQMRNINPSEEIYIQMKKCNSK